jgi:type VI secretion system FHA domain protein
MRLILHLESAGEQRPVTGDRFTVGRARENDWVLPDPDHHLSRQHCVIERRGDGFCVVDTSSNGVFVNGETAPLGRGHERGLGQGDRLQLGSHTIRVEIEGAAAPARPPERGKMFDPTHVPKAPPKEDAGRVFDHTWIGRRDLGPADHTAAHSARPDPRFQTPPEHRPVDLGRIEQEPSDLFDSEHPAPAPPEAPPPPDHAEAGLFDSDGPGEAPALPQKPDPLDPFASAGPALAPAASPPPAPQPTPTPAAAVPAAPAMPPEPPRAPEAPDTRLIEAFLAGAGLDPNAVPVDDPETFMRAAGARLRELTEGLVQLLNARASVKNVARVERTTIGRDHNNPLKYSVTPQEALLAVLKARGPGFLSPEAAVRGGFRDVQEHELALLDAMQVALRALLQRFEPDGFERQLEAENLFSTLVAGGRRAKCWDAFKARYEQIAGEAEREFLGDVGADFSRGYEARTRRM